MRNPFPLLSSITLTILSWGLYGPVLQSGQAAMSLLPPPHVARLRPFVCVGLAYFLIGVLVAGLWLHLRGEKGEWTLQGIVWSLAGGTVGAIGALGIILAFTFGGKPIYVMPLVFGGAPVVNAYLTIYLARRVKEIGPLFLAGLIIVIIGAVVVIVFAPHGPAPSAGHESAADVQAAPRNVGTAAAAARSAGAGIGRWVAQLLSIALTIVCWGSYGPVLHKGQAAMHHSRLRPLICVGLAYFVIAVVVPYFFLGEMGEASSYRSVGTIWSLAAGAFGALGALGIIMAFNFGGKPVFIMPLVFGGAPVVNALYTVGRQGLWGQINPFFWAGMILVIAGAVMVLVLAPRGDKVPENQELRVKSREPEPPATNENRGASADGSGAGEPLAPG
jgi:hypothetical protein